MSNLPSQAGQSPSNPEVEGRIHAEIRNIGIPPRPTILGRIESEMRKDEPDFNHLAEIIGSDVGLAASVIKVANSPFFGFGKKVRSTSESLLVIGLKMTLNTVAGIALQKTFPHIPSLERFWDSAAKTARVSSWLAQRFKRKLQVRPEDAYTFGLFRDCGIPLLMIPFPDYAQTLKRANEETQRIFTSIEDEVFSINHAIVGAELAQDWQLPEEISQAIRYHHEPSSLSGPQDANSLPVMTRELIAITQTAEFLIQQVTGLSQTHEWDKLGNACMQLLDISADELASLEDEVRNIASAEL